MTFSYKTGYSRHRHTFIFFRNKLEVVEKVNAYLTVNGILNLSVVTYYEVLNGLLYKDAHKQLEKFERFIDLNQVIFLNVEIAT